MPTYAELDGRKISDHWRESLVIPEILTLLKCSPREPIKPDFQEI